MLIYIYIYMLISMLKILFEATKKTQLNSTTYHATSTADFKPLSQLGQFPETRSDTRGAAAAIR